ncbi:hypothetical protein LAZ67_8000914 [Cordylochernes scorpioides]|uniref:DUF5641 domain-containing protein n=1 Tax=Cordylochernes scorpioides TaxID=51811 RepID=A0ABY6KPS3_9ARAC|nr:hypothetical protein LAZ67_8000914 [Cordylochernes scorpioides]
MDAISPPAMYWSLGRITKVFPGADGKVRVVEIYQTYLFKMGIEHSRESGCCGNYGAVNKPAPFTSPIGIPEQFKEGSLAEFHLLVGTLARVVTRDNRTRGKKKRLAIITQDLFIPNRSSWNGTYLSPTWNATSTAQDLAYDFVAQNIYNA